VLPAGEEGEEGKGQKIHEQAGWIVAQLCVDQSPLALHTTCTA
jgi:hypothetical protein